MNDALEKRRKQIIYRSNHRGIKEMDIVIGGYANAFVMDMPIEVLDEFEKIISELDRDLLTWFVGEVEVPEHIKSPLFDRILKHTVDGQ